MTSMEDAMFNKCNIDKTDRINRVIIGAAIALAAIFGASKLFFIILGLVMVVQGFIGWCSIPVIIAKLKAFIINSK